MKIFRLWKVTVWEYLLSGEIGERCHKKDPKIFRLKRNRDKREIFELKRHVTHKPVTLMQWIRGAW